MTSYERPHTNRMPMLTYISTYQHIANFLKIDAESKRCYERSEYVARHHMTRKVRQLTTGTGLKGQGKNNTD
jgi:hypothetical protein